MSIRLGAALGVGIEVEAVVLWLLLGRIRGRNGAQSVQRGIYWKYSWHLAILGSDLSSTNGPSEKGSRMASKAF